MSTRSRTEDPAARSAEEDRRTTRPAVPDADRSFATRIKEWANVIAPVTLITALLIYFGYIGTRSRLEYFGVDLDLAELSNQDLVLSGLEVIYFPATMLFLAVLVTAPVHAGITLLLTSPRRDGASIALGSTLVTLGILLMSRALIGLFVVRISRAETPGTTPLALAIGPCVLAYGTWIIWRVLRRRTARATRLMDWYEGAPMRRLRTIATVGLAGLLLAGLFWAANSFAWSFGAGLAYDDAERLSDRPEVVLDTKERLLDLPADINETVLDAAVAGPYRYRYRGLRLLIQSHNRLFLVPANWTGQARTLVVPYDSNVRIQLIPNP